MQPAINPIQPLSDIIAAMKLQFSLATLLVCMTVLAVVVRLQRSFPVLEARPKFNTG